MDAHIFRRLCDSLALFLPGARLEKIQSPMAGVQVLTFYARHSKQALILRHDRRNPFLFLSSARHSTGQAPTAATMRLRKYAAGRRVKACVFDFADRCLHLCFQRGGEAALAAEGPEFFAEVEPSPVRGAAKAPELRGRPEQAARREEPASPASPDNPASAEVWISLDLREGPVLRVGARPLAVAALWPRLLPAVDPALLRAGGPDCPVLWIQPAWPPASVLCPAASSTGAPCGDAAEARIWQAWPVLTPALRRSLPHLDAGEQAALLMDLEYGGGDLFVYTAPDSPQKTPSPLEISAWPLPAALRRGRTEQIFADPLEALALVGAHEVLGGMERAGQRAAASPHSREAKRLERILAKLQQEQERLQRMAAGKEKALYLQSVLWAFGPDDRPGALLCPATPGLPPCPFDPASLQPQKSLRQNMEALFHTAARGLRGLTMLEQRRALLQGQCAAARDSALLAASLGPAAVGRARQGQKNVSRQCGLAGPNHQISPARPSSQASPAGSACPSSQTSPASPAGPARSAKPALERLLPKNVESFVSVDGLIILRGKDAKGNLALLKVAAPHDLWMHVAGGPGAHTVVRRAFAGQEIPAATLEQSAVLAASKSWQKGNGHVGVQCAELRHVKALRGAATGTVRVDKVAGILWVDLPPGLP